MFPLIVSFFLLCMCNGHGYRGNVYYNDIGTYYTHLARDYSERILSPPPPIDPTPYAPTPAPYNSAPYVSPPAPIDSSPYGSPPVPIDPAPYAPAPTPFNPAPYVSPPAPYVPTPAPFNPTPYDPTPAPLNPTPYAPTPSPSHPTPSGPAATPSESASAPSPKGITDITKDLMATWSSACGSSSGGTIDIKPGTFILNQITFKGPCKGLTKFNINGILKAPNNNPFKGEKFWVSFTNVDGLQISGNGTFNGQGPIAWKYNTCDKGHCENAPLPSSTNATLEGFTSLNSKFFHLHISNCDDFNINNIKIMAPGDSPNTDGMHISKSNKVTVKNVKIATGDDCISLGPGTTNINISSIICGPGHGISIGSLGRSQGERPVEGITVSNSTFIGTQNGARIKTFGSSFSSSVSNVTFKNLKMNDVKNPIIIDQDYCPHHSCKQKGNSNVKITNVKFINIRGTSASNVSVQLLCSGKVPCQKVELQDLNLTYMDNHVTTKATCSNFKGTFDGNHHQFPQNFINVD